MTVAREPRLEGERNPKRAKTVQPLIKPSDREYSLELAKCGSNHGNKLRTIADHDRQLHRLSWSAKDFSVDELPTPIFLYILLYGC